MKSSKLKVAVLGAGNWAKSAHIPGWQRDPRSEVAVLCDPRKERADEMCKTFAIPETSADWRAVVARPDIDVVDVCTPSATHFELAWAALEAGKHVLCEKPVAYDFHDTQRAAELARSKGLKTKLGFTFRYSPGVQYAWSMIQEGFVGTPFIFNAYEQNSQFLDPLNPLRQYKPEADPQRAANLIAGRLWRAGDRHQPLVGTGRLHPGGRHHAQLRPEPDGARHRKNDARQHRRRRHLSGGVCQWRDRARSRSSFVTIGNYPGIEVRLYGEKGAIICRLVEEFGVAETIKVARPRRRGDSRSSRSRRSFYPSGGHPRECVAIAVLRQPDQRLHRRDRRPAARATRAISSMAPASRKSSTPSSDPFHQRRWVDLPLE